MQDHMTLASLPQNLVYYSSAPNISVGDCNNEVSFANNLVAFNCPLSINTDL